MNGEDYSVSQLETISLSSDLLKNNFAGKFEHLNRIGSCLRTKVSGCLEMCAIGLK